MQIDNILLLYIFQPPSDEHQRCLYFPDPTSPPAVAVLQDAELIAAQFHDETAAVTNGSCMKRRSVHFKNTVTVILIPSRGEYIAAGLVPMLWWMEADFSMFYKSAMSDLACFMRMENVVPVVDVGRSSYQSGFCFQPYEKMTVSLVGSHTDDGSIDGTASKTLSPTMPLFINKSTSRNCTRQLII